MYHRRNCNLTLLLLLLLLLAGAAYTGHTGNAALDLPTFPQDGLYAAVDRAKLHFKLRFPGFTLTRIRYDEVASWKEFQILTEQTACAPAPGNAVTLLCDFSTGRSSGSFAPYSRYTGWKVTMVRTSAADGWRVVDSGFA